MENHLLYTLWILQMASDAIWTNEHPLSISMSDK